MPRWIFDVMEKAKQVVESEKGQDLAEYALTFSVIALGTVAGMGSVAHNVDQTFVGITNVISNSIT